MIWEKIKIKSPICSRKNGAGKSAPTLNYGAATLGRLLISCEQERHCFSPKPRIPDVNRAGAIDIASGGGIFGKSWVRESAYNARSTQRDRSTVNQWQL